MKLIRKNQLGNPIKWEADATRFSPRPRLMLEKERRQKQLDYEKQVKDRKNKQERNRQQKLHKEQQIAKEALQNKREREQKAIETIKSGKHYEVMDQTVQELTPSAEAVAAGAPKTTFQKTPEQQFVYKATPYKGNWVEDAVAGVITAPIAGTTFLKLINNPFFRRLASQVMLDVGANSALNSAYSLTTNRNLGNDINYVTNSNIGDLATFTLSGALRRGLGKSVFNTFVNSDITKRGLETILRGSGGQSTPFYELGRIQHQRNNLEIFPKERKKAILNYILFGKEDEILEPWQYKSLATSKKNYYGGIFDKSGELQYNNDLIDQFLFGRQVSPKYLTLTNDSDFGIHTNYINNTYKNKAGDIKIYQSSVPKNTTKTNQFDLSTAQVEGTHTNLVGVSPRTTINTGGHLKLIDTSGNSIEQDIWKFNPEEFRTKWLQGNLVTSKDGYTRSTKYAYTPNPQLNSFNLSDIKSFIQQIQMNSLINSGLKILDASGTPIIIRTPYYIQN